VKLAGYLTLAELSSESLKIKPVRFAEWGPECAINNLKIWSFTGRIP